MRTVYRWLEIGAIHFSETVGQGLLICLSSLATNISQASGISSRIRALRVESIDSNAT
jgi:hypothetical protein